MDPKAEGGSKFKTFSCPVCHKIYFSYLKLLQHKLSHQLRDSVETEPVEPSKTDNDVLEEEEYIRMLNSGDFSRLNCLNDEELMKLGICNSVSLTSNSDSASGNHEGGSKSSITTAPVPIKVEAPDEPENPSVLSPTGEPGLSSSNEKYTLEQDAHSDSDSERPIASDMGPGALARSGLLPESFSECCTEPNLTQSNDDKDSNDKQNVDVIWHRPIDVSSDAVENRNVNFEDFPLSKSNDTTASSLHKKDTITENGSSLTPDPSQCVSKETALSKDFFEPIPSTNFPTRSCSPLSYTQLTVHNAETNQMTNLKENTNSTNLQAEIDPLFKIPALSDFEAFSENISIPEALVPCEIFGDKPEIEEGSLTVLKPVSLAAYSSSDQTPINASAVLAELSGHTTSISSTVAIEKPILFDSSSSALCDKVATSNGSAVEPNSSTLDKAVLNSPANTVSVQIKKASADKSLRPKISDSKNFSPSKTQLTKNLLREIGFFKRRDQLISPHAKAVKPQFPPIVLKKLCLSEPTGKIIVTETVSSPSGPNKNTSPLPGSTNSSPNTTISKFDQLVGDIPVQSSAKDTNLQSEQLSKPNSELSAATAMGSSSNLVAPLPKPLHTNQTFKSPDGTSVMTLSEMISSLYSKGPHSTQKAQPEMITLRMSKNFKSYSRCKLGTSPAVSRNVPKVTVLPSDPSKSLEVNISGNESNSSSHPESPKLQKESQVPVVTIVPQEALNLTPAIGKPDLKTATIVETTSSKSLLSGNKGSPSLDDPLTPAAKANNTTLSHISDNNCGDSLSKFNNDEPEIVKEPSLVVVKKVNPTNKVGLVSGSESVASPSEPHPKIPSDLPTALNPLKQKGILIPPPVVTKKIKLSETTSTKKASNLSPSLLRKTDNSKSPIVPTNTKKFLTLPPVNSNTPTFQVKTSSDKLVSILGKPKVGRPKLVASKKISTQNKISAQALVTTSETVVKLEFPISQKMPKTRVTRRQKPPETLEDRTCLQCKKEFATKVKRNRHVRAVHRKQFAEVKKKLPVKIVTPVPKVNQSIDFVAVDQGGLQKDGKQVSPLTDNRISEEHLHKQSHIKFNSPDSLLLKTSCVADTSFIEAPSSESVVQGAIEESNNHRVTVNSNVVEDENQKSAVDVLQASETSVILEKQLIIVQPCDESVSENTSCQATAEQETPLESTINNVSSTKIKVTCKVRSLPKEVLPKCETQPTSLVVIKSEIIPDDQMIPEPAVISKPKVTPKAKVIAKKKVSPKSIETPKVDPSPKIIASKTPAVTQKVLAPTKTTKPVAPLKTVTTPKIVTTPKTVITLKSVSTSKTTIPRTVTTPKNTTILKTAATLKSKLPPKSKVIPKIKVPKKSCKVIQNPKISVKVGIPEAMDVSTETEVSSILIVPPISEVSPRKTLEFSKNKENSSIKTEEATKSGEIDTEKKNVTSKTTYGNPKANATVPDKANDKVLPNSAVKTEEPPKTKTSPKSKTSPNVKTNAKISPNAKASPSAKTSPSTKTSPKTKISPKVKALPKNKASLKAKGPIKVKVVPKTKTSPKTKVPAKTKNTVKMKVIAKTKIAKKIGVKSKVAKLKVIPKCKAIPKAKSSCKPKLSKAKASQK